MAPTQVGAKSSETHIALELATLEGSVMRSAITCLLVSLMTATVALAVQGALALSDDAIKVARCVQVETGRADLPRHLLDADGILTDFVASSGDPAPVQTRAVVLHDGANLHFVVECLEPRMDALVAKCTDRDGNVFADDCVELFISREYRGAEYYHLVTNALGARFDERVKERSWDPDWSVRPWRGPDRWGVEVSIPFAQIGGPPAAGDVWWVNICRQRQARGACELSAWSPTAADFHNTARFGALVFDQAYAGYLKRAILDPWDARAKGLEDRARAAGEAGDTLAPRLERLRTDLLSLRQAAAGEAPRVPQFGALLRIGADALAALDTVEQDVGEVLRRAETTQAMRALAQPGQQLLAYSVKAITNRRILPNPDPPESISRKLSFRACRGEQSPASFVAYSLEGSVRLEVRVSDLRGPQGVVPSSAVDVRAVKCWYQSGDGGGGDSKRFPINQGLRVLVPELLLKDDDLVRVDTENRENFVRLDFPDGRREWLWISSPETTPEERDVSVAAMPIRDARTLQPVHIPRKEGRQFWVTLKVPDDAAAGRYAGTVELWSVGKLLETLDVELEVLPFDLEPNPLESSIYFHWGITMDVDGQGTVQHGKRSPAQFKAELENLLAHGVDNPTFSVRYNTGWLPLELRLRQEVGMRTGNMYYLVGPHSTPDAEAREIMDLARSFGFEQVYFYGDDEAHGDALRAQRDSWQRIRSLGGRVFVAGSRNQNFPIVGDVQDLLVCYGTPTKEEAALWHSKGHKIFCYANPQSGIEEPETYRRNFGLLLAANDYDGGMTYIYYHGWNDFSGTTYRQHNFVYPTVDGVIDTIQWEGYREGITDLRYLGTLRKAIREASARGGESARHARRAQEFAGSMDVSGDLDALRGEMIRWILALSGS